VLPLLAVPQVVTQLGSGPEALRGLTGLGVLAETTSQNIGSLGVTESWLEQRVVRGLERAGVPVLASPALRATARGPLVVVRVQSVKVPDRRAFAWHLSLVVHRNVDCLDSASTEIRVPVWATESAIGVTSAPMLASSVSESLDEQLAELARAWKVRERRE
jgi:hypothetical protein